MKKQLKQLTIQGLINLLKRINPKNRVWIWSGGLDDEFPLTKASVKVGKGKYMDDGLPRKESCWHKGNVLIAD